MNFYLLSCLLLVEAFVACRAGVPSAAELQQIVDKHNKLRSQEGSSKMQPMKWSDKLAGYAATWAKGCQFKHGQPPEAGSGHIGQNLYVSTVKSPNYDGAVQNWYNEKPDYNLAANSCTHGKMCGHYTQIVWATTTEVGCAAQVCDSIGGTSFRGGHIVVCNYLPPGNWVGQKPY
ncbi:hypothetical protein HELRODRAFT_185908 [Helobdella robusta]|uniref:SCP domain-containing protein n=1 Tax=Helobdella robusta TaxID=6412 RepID=T1FNF5_HELRO|nr:hypothetical protein HELRODRAFT_185908 [Helobdella robusta]ESN97584.1 hypothetical protein HELRODRAFT_185908 [Helobdella robusta]